MGNPHEELMLREDAGGGGPTDHSVQLTAQMQGQNVVVTGNGGFTFANKSGAHRLNFSLNDQTGLNVTFLSLDRQDNCSTCPPQSGDNSSQIVGVQTNGTSAAFTDNNSGDPTSVCYQWNFSCNDSSKLPIKYDPILNNGGNTTSNN